MFKYIHKIRSLGRRTDLCSEHLSTVKRWRERPARSQEQESPLGEKDSSSSDGQQSCSFWNSDTVLTADRRTWTWDPKSCESGGQNELRLRRKRY